MADVIIIMGSKADMKHAEEIAAGLRGFAVSYEFRIASAHKSPSYLLDLLAAYEAEDDDAGTSAGPRRVYITVAGRSNALSGMVDAAVTAPVIACPPYSDRFAGADVYSSLRMPSGVAPALVLEPAGAALLAAKILGRRAAVRSAQETQAARLVADDQALRGEDQ